MPYFINQSTDTRPTGEQVSELTTNPRFIPVKPVPSHWSDADIKKYLADANIRENRVRVLFLLTYEDGWHATHGYTSRFGAKETEQEALMGAQYDAFLNKGIIFRHSMPNTQTQFYILLDPPSTTNFTLPALPASQPEAKVVRAPAKKESQTLALGDTDRLYSLCCKGIMMQCQKLPILLLTCMHPLQEALKSLLIVGWSVSALADPQGENPWTLLSLLAPAAVFLYSYRSIPLHRARDILLEGKRYPLQVFQKKIKARVQALFESVQIGLMAYALFTRSALSPCLSAEEGLPQVPQEYFIPLFLSVFLGLVRMSHLFFSKIEDRGAAGRLYYTFDLTDSRDRRELLSDPFSPFLALLLRLPAPYVLDAFSVGLYLSPLLKSLIPFFAVYCVVNSLIPAFIVAAAHMAFEREYFYSDNNLISNNELSPDPWMASRGFARYLLYPVQWVLDAVTHTMAAVIGFFFDPIMTMAALEVLGQVCIGWMLGEFWRIYLTPYMPMNVKLDVLPYVISAIGLFSGIIETFNHLVRQNFADEYDERGILQEAYIGTLIRYQMFFSEHTGQASGAFCLRYLEHALSVGKWIKDVTKATGKMLGLYRNKDGVDFFCCDSSGVPVSEATVVAMDNPVGPAAGYGTRTPEAAEKQPRSCSDFFVVGAKELRALCGRRAVESRQSLVTMGHQ